MAPFCASAPGLGIHVNILTYNVLCGWMGVLFLMQQGELRNAWQRSQRTLTQDINGAVVTLGEGRLAQEMCVANSALRAHVASLERRLAISEAVRKEGRRQRQRGTVHAHTQMFVSPPPIPQELAHTKQQFAAMTQQLEKAKKSAAASAAAAAATVAKSVMLPTTPTAAAASASSSSSS